MTTAHTQPPADRPWLPPVESAISRETIRAWRAATWTAVIDDDTLARPDRFLSLLPGISVVVPTHQGAAHISRCM